MSQMNQVSMSFLISALLVCVMDLLFTLIQQRTDKIQNKLYVALLTVLSANSLCCVYSDYIMPLLPPDMGFAIRRVTEFLYFLLHTALCPLFFYYVSCVCGAAFRKRPLQNLLVTAPFALTELLVILNPVTHWVYYFDENREFERNWAEMLIYAAAALYMIFAFGMLLHAWNALNKKRKTALLCFLGVVIIGVLLQLANEDLKIELFGEALGLTGIMLAVETEDDLTDPVTNVYNRRAMRMHLKSAFVNKQPLYLIGIRVTDADRLAKLIGSENTDILEKPVTDYLKTLAPRYNIYGINPGTFAVLLYNASPEEAADFAETVSRRFENTWQLGDRDFPLNALIMTAQAPERIKRPTDAFFMLDSPIPSGNDKKILSGSDLDYLLRLSSVESAVTRGLTEHSFEVYYQPTYHLNDRKLHGAEALLRMHDKDLGNVFPDEFIPVAEHIGMIDAIDDFVLREVCRFIATGIPQKYGMDCINVNLSVLECMKPGFVEHINKIVEEAGVDKSFLNFEITETVAADDYDLLSGVVADLQKEGFRFSMDDYGTGYSNMHAILSLNLDVIKIDKSILWGAEQSELGYIILENSVRMIRQMHRQILVEGVETAEQVDLLGTLHVDYLQGFFFSRPIPEKDFVELIEQKEEG